MYWGIFLLMLLPILSLIGQDNHLSNGFISRKLAEDTLKLLKKLGLRFEGDEENKIPECKLEDLILSVKPSGCEEFVSINVNACSRYCEFEQTQDKKCFSRCKKDKTTFVPIRCNGNVSVEVEKVLSCKCTKQKCKAKEPSENE